MVFLKDFSEKVPKKQIQRLQKGMEKFYEELATMQKTGLLDIFFALDFILLFVLPVNLLSD